MPGNPAVRSNMKQDYTLDELQTEMTALAQLFDSVTLADPAWACWTRLLCSR